MIRIYFGVHKTQSKPNETNIKKMADLLIHGATLTDLVCPECASPLFRLKNGTLWCGVDEKKVIIVKEDEEAPKPATNSAIDKLESTLMAKIQNLQDKIEKTDDVEELGKLTATMNELLNGLEKIKKMKS